MKIGLEIKKIGAILVTLELECWSRLPQFAVSPQELCAGIVFKVLLKLPVLNVVVLHMSPQRGQMDERLTEATVTE